MAVNLSPVGGVAAQFFDNAGNVLTGGKLFTYSAGTTTPQIAYTTSLGNIAWSNPIILDAAGRVSGSGEIWLTDTLQYKFILRDSNDVLIATYDNVTGINSNFVNFTNAQEIQTATANQTVFNLTTTTYSPGTNSLSVFVDGVNQYGPGAQYAYLETDSDTVTFVNGLHVGALVKFTTSQINSSSSGDASQIAFTGFKGQVGSVQDLADNDGSNWIGFEQAGTGAVAVSAQDKMREIVSVTDFGADPTGATDSTAQIQAAWDSIKSANGSLFFPAGTYRCDDVLDFTVNYVSNNHFHAVIGECATIDFSNTALTTGEMITFGSDVGLFEEKSRFVMEGFSLIGPSLGSITPTSSPPHTLTGIFFNYAINLTLRDITVFNFYVGYKVDFCFPIVASAILSDNCYVGLQLVADVTCSSWVGCSFKEGRFGVVIQPKATNKTIYGQTFIRPNLEGNDVGMVLDPLNSGSSGVWDINVIDPYMEAITYDGFRIGRALDYSNASVVGADRLRFVYNIRITGGLWDGQWGTSGHQPVVFHAADSGNAPAGCVIDIPVQLSTSSIGFARKTQLNNRIDIYQGAGTIITDETQYQRQMTSLSLSDGVAAPNTETGRAQIYVDTADGDLKIRFSDGTTKTIVTDT
jgi:hypothetical protein